VAAANNAGSEQPVKALLTITAAVEAATGVAFVVTPSSLVLMLVGSPLDLHAGVIIARVLGAALLSLAAACWLARRDVHSRAAAGVIAAMLLYNIAVASLLVAARFGSGMSGAGLQPAVILHSALAVWCVACLRRSALPRLPGAVEQV
jgi:hypothetical protein